MKLDNIDVGQTIAEVQRLLEQEKGLSPSFKALIKLLITLVITLTHRINLNSSNSSKPPSSDPNRKKKTNPRATKRRPGGQHGHAGTNLEPVDDPDEVEYIRVDRSTIPPGRYKEVGYESRQVFNIKISTFVTEYQAQVLEDQHGKRFVAPFPEGVNCATQYGTTVKAHAVYLSQSQLIPYQRVQDHFLDQLQMSLSTGSIYNFNQQAYEALEEFDRIAKIKLIASLLLHADETGTNVGGKRIWLHCASNPLWTYYYPHQKRGLEAMQYIGILSNFTGILCHDHWKPYYKLHCTHALCNAHHLRELTRAWEQDGQKWALKMHRLLKLINSRVKEVGGVLCAQEINTFKRRYKRILNNAQLECPPPDKPNPKGKRGRVKRSKARNLLERLIDYEDDVLRFMEIDYVPFTNNLGENDLRMTKVQQKISGCFRSIQGAYIFCRIRSYLSTCRKHNMTASDALNMLFNGQLPGFIAE